MKKILVCGGGGLIGGAMVKRLKFEEGHWVRSVDIKKHEFININSVADDELLGDLTNQDFCERIFDDSIDEVYQFAADMGGAGYIFTGENDANVMHNSSLINLNISEQCVKHKISKVFYSSSACMYPEYNQNRSKQSNLFRRIPHIQLLLIQNMAGKSYLVKGFG